MAMDAGPAWGLIDMGEVEGLLALCWTVLGLWWVCRQPTPEPGLADDLTTFSL